MKRSMDKTAEKCQPKILRIKTAAAVYLCVKRSSVYMSPAAHLFASWIIAAKTTDNVRDRRLVTLAGILPDLDGLGVLADLAGGGASFGNFYYYQHYHHYLLHGLFTGVALAVGCGLLARQQWRVVLVALAVFHIHLLCDLAGSRGPEPEDLWPIHYFGPWARHPQWIWTGQWELGGWINRALSVLLFGWALVLAMRLGDSFVGVLNRQLDAVFVGTLRKWTRQPRKLSGPVAENFKT